MDRIAQADEAGDVIKLLLRHLPDVVRGSRSGAVNGQTHAGTLPRQAFAPLAYDTGRVSLGVHFEREIREQPEVWERIARADASAQLAGALEGEVLLIGSGSSLFAAQLGAIALRRRGMSAHALAASEARGDNRAYQQRVIVAISQSGRSADILSALDVLHPKRTIALTNSIESPLAARADVTVDVLAGPEFAIPASKSVSSTIAILLSAASLLGGDHTRDPADADSHGREHPHLARRCGR